MTGEDLGFAMEVLFREGALEVFYQPVQMKKNRPGILLHCFCRPDEEEKFASLILKYTTTRGLRAAHYGRYKMEASFDTVRTPYGDVRIKKNTGYGTEKSKYEFEDLKKIALEQNLSLDQVRQLLK